MSRKHVSIFILQVTHTALIITNDLVFYYAVTLLLFVRRNLSKHG